MILSVQGMGALYAFLTFIICILLVFGFRLARIGWRTLRKKLPADPPPKDEKPAEPVYFLVERKKNAPGRNIPDPKRIDFK